MRRRGRLGAAVLGSVVVLMASATAADGPTPVVPEDLSGKALDRGSVRVIVQLRVVAHPEGQLGSVGAEAAQRQAIAAAQSALLAELIGSTYRIVRSYETIPFLALEVSPDALRTLERSSLVVSVEEDRLESPQIGPDVPSAEKDRSHAHPNSGVQR